MTIEWHASKLNQYPAHLGARIGKGMGCGTGGRYLPWHTARQIRSGGTSDNPTSIRNGRTYQLLSTFETIYFLLMERKPSVFDIREQFPIFDIDITLALASQYGIPHRKGEKGDKRPEPYTIDFVVDEMVDGKALVRAASIKPPGQILTPEDEAKLSIEYSWCERNGIQWELIDMASFANPLTTLNTLWFIRGWHINNWTPDKSVREMFKEHFLGGIYQRNVVLTKLLDQMAKRLYLSKREAEDAFRYSAWVGDIPVSFDHDIQLNLPLVLK